MRRLLRFWRLAGDDFRLLWFALRHPDRPGWLVPASALLGLYALEPMNFAIPMLGLVDDFVLVPLMLHALLKFLPTNITAASPRSRAAR